MTITNILAMILCGVGYMAMSIIQRDNERNSVINCSEM